MEEEAINLVSHRFRKLALRNSMSTLLYGSHVINHHYIFRCNSHSHSRFHMSTQGPLTLLVVQPTLPKCHNSIHRMRSPRTNIHSMFSFFRFSSTFTSMEDIHLQQHTGEIDARKSRAQEHTSRHEFKLHTTHTKYSTRVRPTISHDRRIIPGTEPPCPA